MNIRVVILLVVFALNLPAAGQLQPLLDQYSLNGMAINPAYSGSKEALSVGLSVRNQWVGFEGSPAYNNTFGPLSPEDR